MLGLLGAGGVNVTYLYIDAAYLLAEYAAQMTSFFDEPGALDLDAIREDAHASKAYYYECVDDIARADEGPEDLQRRVAAQDGELARIRRLRRFHVREGVLRGEGRRKRRQKKIDVQLAVDMLMHRVAGVVSRTILIAGDLDFFPVVESLVQLGVNVAVWHGESAAEDLLAAADEARRLTLSDFYAWSTERFRSSHSLPKSWAGGYEPVGSLVRSGTWDSRRVRLKVSDTDQLLCLYVDPAPSNSSLTLMFKDERRLLSYFTSVYGQIEWDQM